ncbi:HAD-like domain-containing protein [Mycena alexandri]|uniref:HAD-like domain-containing protein n=1 Tax=Mycena alexandri TaxID=1745969 RepID=A0AAD6TKP3_9AGAR|nr:HAD-like domain-containing protein [Mycena alexandri]
MKIRLITFDLHQTLITPRYPIHVQYARAFEPYLGPLDHQALKRSFGIALRQLQAEKPLYGNHKSSWWSEVVRRTALEAGADSNVLEDSLSLIMPRLMASFGSKEGYKPFDDSFGVLDALHSLNLRTAVVSNGDSRMLSVLRDLGFPLFLSPIILSEIEAVEKPSSEIFQLAVQRVNVDLEEPIVPSECVHVGDELECDYHGAKNAGMNALLLERTGAEKQVTNGVEEAVPDLHKVLDWVRARI